MGWVCGDAGGVWIWDLGLGLMLGVSVRYVILSGLVAGFGFDFVL